ncbi:MAG: hypothetical protein V8T00_03825 [Oscillospiraceae bacterium]
MISGRFQSRGTRALPGLRRIFIPMRARPVWCRFQQISYRRQSYDQGIPFHLSADFCQSQARYPRAFSRGSRIFMFHIDVMDGEFVPNITIGIPVVAAIRKITELPLDVHWMIDRAASLCR